MWTQSVTPSEKTLLGFRDHFLLDVVQATGWEKLAG